MVRETPFDLGLRAWIVAEACAGLHAAHELGFLHHEVRPAHVMLGLDGSVKVLDFRIARLARRVSRMMRDPDESRYLSPEQCRGRPLDRCIDI